MKANKWSHTSTEKDTSTDNELDSSFDSTQWSLKLSVGRRGWCRYRNHTLAPRSAPWRSGCIYRSPVDYEFSHAMWITKTNWIVVEVWNQAAFVRRKERTDRDIMCCPLTNVTSGRPCIITSAIWAKRGHVFDFVNFTDFWYTSCIAITVNLTVLISFWGMEIVESFTN